MGTITLIRHGQTVFNAAWLAGRPRPTVPDPGLTDVGIHQALQLKAWLGSRRFDRVFTSPYTRTLQTVRLCNFKPATVRVELCLREEVVHACDIGSPPQALAARFPEYSLGHIPDNWWQLATSMQERVQAFRELLNTQAGLSVAVVGHRGFFLAMTGLGLENCEVLDYSTEAPVAAPCAVSAPSIIWRPPPEAHSEATATQKENG